MQCPACNSDQTQRLEVIYEGGTQSIKATSYTGGVMGSTAARLGLGGAVTATSGESQSKLAQRLAPPAKKKIKLPLFFLLLGVPTIGAAAMSASPIIGTAFAYLLGGLTLAWIVYAIKFNFMDRPGLFREWASTWYCNKCGTVYKPE